MLKIIKTAATAVKRGYQKAVEKAAAVSAAVVGTVGSVLGVSGMSSDALADLPTEATAAFSQIQSNGTDIFAAVWPLVAFFTGGWILIKLFKKGANKAA